MAPGAKVPVATTVVLETRASRARADETYAIAAFLRVECTINEMPTTTINMLLTVRNMCCTSRA